MEFKEQLKSMSDAEWENFYWEEFLKSEKHANFKLDDRFKWVFKKVHFNSKFLDIGCGNGYLCKRIEEKKCDVTGVDVSDNIGLVAKKNVPNMTYVTAHADKHLPFEDCTFDYISSLEVLEHVKDMDNFLSEAVRVLKKGGTLLLSVPKENQLDCPSHINYFDFYTLADLLFKLKDVTFVIYDIFKFNERDGRQLFAVEVKKNE